LWEHLGLDFDEDGSHLYVVSPETDHLVQFDTAANVETGRLLLDPDPEAHSYPFDVEVTRVQTLAGGVQERVYVANHGDGGVVEDDTMSIVTVHPTNFAASTVVPFSLNEDFDHPDHLHMDRVAGLETVFPGGTVRGRLLYLVSRDTNQLLVYNLATNGDQPTPRIQLPIVRVSPAPGDIAFQNP
jgi:DNA-binding beta-propeller fold protein YncE